MFNKEMEGFDGEVEMFDEEAEIEASDEEPDLSDDAPTGMELAPMGSTEECPYCGLNKVLAESKLHVIPPACRDRLGVRNLSQRKVPLHRVQTGSCEGCSFCGLLLDAIKVWQKKYRHRLLMSAFDYVLSGKDGQFRLGLRMLMENWPDVSVFRGTGCQSQWNLCGPPQIPGDTSSPEASKTARRWLQTCKNTHDLCKRNTSVQEAPKRILELDGEQIKLCEGLQSTVVYACLSHCWGPLGPAMKLGADTIATLKAGIPLATLPKTFSDAACFCWRLGIHYIWIDALCILQDSEEDWNEATAYMANIYEGAAVTIAATWSNSSNDGCFAPATTKVSGNPLREPGIYMRGRLERFSREAGLAFNDNWPLLDRAWVFQERKLSTRVLHFGKDQLIWECNSGFTSEDAPNSLYQNDTFEDPGDDDFKTSKLEDPTRDWRHAVEYYSGLKLTYETDRLPAIAGYVERMQKRRPGDVYIAGMWLDSLLSDLDWYPVHDKPRSRPCRPGTVMPSWSWISVSSGVFFRRFTPLPSLKLIDVVYDITGPAHIGQVSRASITLEGLFLLARIVPDDSKRFEILGGQDLSLGEDRPLFKVVYSGWDFGMGVEDANGENTDDEDTDDKDTDDEDTDDEDIYDEEFDDDDELFIPPIDVDQEFIVLLLSQNNHADYFLKYNGIVLHKHDDKQYTRVGFLQLGPTEIALEYRALHIAARKIASLRTGRFTIV